MTSSFPLLESHLQTWAVPSDVRAAIQRALTIVAGEGVDLVEALLGDEVAVAVRSQPEAMYVSPSRVSIALSPPDADRAYRSDSAYGLDKQTEATWIVHCRYGRLDPSRLNTVTSLMVRALRRYAPRPAQPAPATRTRRRASKDSAATRATAATDAPRARRTNRQAEEDRQRAVEAAIPRCPVPGCNLPMVGGSCGFHD